MRIKLQKVIFYNRAPFPAHLNLDFEDSNLAVLSGINGRGKTTVLSYIVDAFYEMARKEFDSEFEDKSNKFYKLSPSWTRIDMTQPAIIYLRFTVDSSNIVDYLHVQGECSQKQYDKAIFLDNKIPYTKFYKKLNENKECKIVDISENIITHKKVTTKSIFNKNLMTYFPSYRYEQPGYLNDPYKVRLNFNVNTPFDDYLKNPIEVITDLPNIANWILDLSLDYYLKENNDIDDNNTEDILSKLQEIFTEILRTKSIKNVGFTVVTRHYGMNRILIVDTETGEPVYPSIFTLSSGEAALLCIFAELLKQADKINKNCDNVTGIVLIDEVDKHLHIKLQKEVLPKLFALFPNVQFIVSSHSPFFNMGVADEKELKSVVFDLDHEGMPTEADNNDLFKEVYSMMVNKNAQYAQMYETLKQKIEEDSRTLIITEGKTDVKHLKNAFNRLKLDPLDAEFVDIENTNNGDTQLLQRLKAFSIIKRTNKIIGIFDRDNNKILEELNAETERYKSLGNNVYAFAIPLVNTRAYGSKISIEHYYLKRDLLKKDKNGRRLFLGKEFYESGISKDGKYLTKLNIKNKIEINGIVENRVHSIKDRKMETDIALTKNNFSELVSDDEYSKDFDFSNFRKIYNIIKEIIECPNPN